MLSCHMTLPQPLEGDWTGIATLILQKGKLRHREGNKDVLGHSGSNIGPLFFFFKPICLFLPWVFTVVHRLSLVVACGLLTVVASLVAEHRLSSCGAQA